MDMCPDNFTLYQKETFARVKQIETDMKEAFDPTSFVLNKKMVELANELFNIQQECHHIWKNGTCRVCGAKEDNV